MKKKILSILILMMLMISSIDIAYADPGENSESDPLSGNQEAKYFDDIMSTDATDYVRDQLLKHNSTISIRFPSEGAEDETWIKEIIAGAIDDCDPQNGDYLRSGIASWSYEELNEVNEDGSVIANVTYQIDFFTTAEQEQQVDKKISEIAKELKLDERADDYERVFAIYKYITSHVQYDSEHLQDDNYTLKYTAYAALFNGKAVCQGYTALFHKLTNKCGVSSRIVNGHVSTGEGHSWNIVRIGDYYYNVDCTWDTGNNSPGGHAYFLKCDASFSDHIRNKEYASEDFYREYPMAYEDHDYIALLDFADCDANNIRVGYNVMATVEDGVVTLSGTGPTWNYSYVEWAEKPPFKDLGITRAIVNDGITELGSGVFEDCGELKTVQLPRGLKNVGFASFARCSNLTTINIPEGVEAIGMFAFQECRALTKMVLPESVMEIGASAFDQCENLTSINIPEKVTRIESNLVSNCYRLTQINIPDGVTFIDYSAFASTGITSIKLPEGIESIEECTFWLCTDLRTIEIPKNVKRIGERAFFGTSELTVIMPEGIESIADNAFENSHQARICAKSGSVAETFAKDHGITFVTPDMIEADSGKTDPIPTVDPGNQQGGKQNPDAQTPKEEAKVEIPEVMLSVTEFTYKYKVQKVKMGKKRKTKAVARVQKPTVSVLLNGKVISAENYDIVWSDESSSAVGEYKATITLKGVYSGMATATYTINPKAVKLKKVAKGKKSFTASWKKLSKNDIKYKVIGGYQLRYSTDPTFPEDKTLTKTVKAGSIKSTKKAVKKLKAKTTYYVQLRTYKKVSGVPYYSAWSKSKKVKTK